MVRRLAWVLALALLVTPGLAHAADPAAAREQLKLGYVLAQDGKYEEALPHFLESLRLDPKGITLLNLADCEEHLGRWVDALGHWVDARQRAQAERSKAIEDEATARAKALEARLPRLVLVLPAGAPADVVVERDGTVLGAPSLGVALPVDPGAHTIVVKAPGRGTATQKVALEEGETRRVELALGPVEVGSAAEERAPPAPARSGEAPARATSPLVYVGFGVAAAGAAAGAITGLMALGAGGDAERACPDLRCSREALDDVESGRTLGTVSTVAFVVAGAGAAVGVFGLLSAPKAPAGVAVSFTPGGAVVRGRF